MQMRTFTQIKVCDSVLSNTRSWDYNIAVAMKIVGEDYAKRIEELALKLYRTVWPSYPIVELTFTLTKHQRHEITH